MRASTVVPFCYRFRSNRSQEGTATKSEAQSARVRMPNRPARPGAPARGSRTGRPIMALLDLLGRRWTLRAIWELRHGEPTFREQQQRCDGMSPSVLNQRLAELRDAGVVEALEGGGYRLSDEGTALLHALAPME